MVESVEISEEAGELLAKILKVKTSTILLKRQRRLLLEELYNQYLDGETEPKKKRKYKTGDKSSNKKQAAANSDDESNPEGGNDTAPQDGDV